jgi:hypothetical protein
MSSLTVDHGCSSQRTAWATVGLANMPLCTSPPMHHPSIPPRRLRFGTIPKAQTAVQGSPLTVGRSPHVGACRPVIYLLPKYGRVVRLFAAPRRADPVRNDNFRDARNGWRLPSAGRHSHRPATSRDEVVSHGARPLPDRQVAGRLCRRPAGHRLRVSLPACRSSGVAIGQAAERWIGHDWS